MAPPQTQKYSSIWWFPEGPQDTTRTSAVRDTQFMIPVAMVNIAPPSN